MTNASSEQITDLIRTALVEQRSENWEAAAKLYEQAITIAPLEAEIWFQLGSCKRRAGETDTALQIMEKASLIAPDRADIELEKASLLQELRMLKEAVVSYNRVLELEPNNLTAISDLAIALQEGGHHREALANLKLAMSLDSEDPVIKLNYGAALMRNGDLEQASRLFRALTEQFPDFPIAWSNLGCALQENRAYEEAQKAHEKAFALAPKHPAIRWNMAMTSLLIGDYRNGFKHFEARRFMPDRKPRDFPGREWTNESLSGRTILVHAEQGLGDTIQFARFLTNLSSRGGCVIASVHSALAHLVEGIEGVSQVIRNGETAPHYDFQMPLLSLPYRLDLDLNNLAGNMPYIVTPESAKSATPTASSGIRAGVVWSGNPNHANDHNRSCPIEALSPLFDRPGITWFSLQVGERSSDIAKISAPLVDLSPDLTDFNVTAATIAELDLVISVDTAVAHLAGAMGKPVWILLPYAPDWRWMSEGDRSPWYESAALFRQNNPGDWRSVVNDVDNALSRSF